MVPDKLIPKCAWKCKGLKMTKTPPKENMVKDFPIDIRTNKTIVTKTMWN